MESNKEGEKVNEELTTPEPVVDAGVVSGESEVAQEEESKNHSPLLAGVILIVVLIAVAALVYMQFFAQTPTEEQSEPVVEEPTEKEIVSELLKNTWSRGNYVSDNEGINRYLDDIETELQSENLPEDGQKLLLLRKALSLSVARDVSRVERTETAVDILFDVYEMPTVDQTDFVYKNAVFPAFLDVFKASGYAVGLVGKLPAEYQGRYQEFLNSGFSEQQAALGAILRFVTDAPDTDYSERDIALISKRAHLAALYLYAFGGTNEAFDAEVKTQLDADVANSETAVPLTFTGELRSRTQPAVELAFANDMSKTFGDMDLSDEAQAEIDQKYENAFVVITESSQVDTTMQNILNRRNAVNYLNSLERRYGSGSTPEGAEDDTVAKLVNAVNYNEATKRNFVSYVASADMEGSVWNPLVTNITTLLERYEALGGLVEEPSEGE